MKRTYRVVLENDPRQISCHRIVTCVEADSAEEAGDEAAATANAKSHRGFRVIACTETAPGSIERGYYRHGDAHLALKGA